jgi:hypothetical protein
MEVDTTNVDHGCGWGAAAVDVVVGGGVGAGIWDLSGGALLVCVKEEEESSSRRGELERNS